MHVALYVSGHGFGHLARMTALAHGLLDRRSAGGWAVDRLTVVGVRAPALAGTDPRLAVRPVALDVGMVQTHSLGWDLGATAAALRAFDARAADLVAAEVAWGRDHGVDRVVTDSAALPLRVARIRGVPGVFVGSFTWDGIYARLPDADGTFASASRALARDYALATRAFLLPFHLPCPSLPDPVAVGLLARSPRLPRAEARRRFGLTPDRRALLVSFGAYGLPDRRFDLDALPPDVDLVACGTRLPDHPRARPVDAPWYPDLVLAADAVVSKPGYGILSECVRAGRPLWWVPRGDYPEEPALVAGRRRFAAGGEITEDDLFDLRFLRREATPAPEPPPPDGVAAVVDGVLGPADAGRAHPPSPLQ